MSAPADATDDTDDTDAVVLAGGTSRRLGRDKLVEEVGGATVVRRVVRALGAPERRVVVVGHHRVPGTLHAREEPPGGGPLAALAAGLAAVRTTRTIVVAGDHAALRPDLVLLLARHGSTADALVPVAGGRDQPLVARYDTRRVRDVAAGLLDRDRRSMAELIAALRVDRLVEDDWRPADPDGASFLDLDTESDLAELRRVVTRQVRAGTTER